MSNDYRNGYSAGYKGYAIKTGKVSKDYKEGYNAGRKKGGKRKKPLP